MRVPVRKILRVMAWVTGALLGGVILAVAGALIWLRTDAGERTVAGFAQELLAGQGFFLSMDGIDGPLPTRLLLVNARLADADGEWFSAREMELALNPGDLLKKTVTVALVRVDTPEVYRLPKLPPPPPEPETAPPAPGPPGYFSLPVAVRLDALAIENLGIHAPLVFPEAEPARDGSPMFRVSVHGSARADAAKPLSVQAKMEAAVASMEQLAAALRSGPPPVGGAGITAGIQATVGETIESAVTGGVTVTAPGSPPDSSGDESYALAYGFEAKLAPDQAALPKAFIEGLGLRLDASGSHDMRGNASKASATLLARDGGQWQPLLARLTGRNLSGALKADLDAALAATGAMNGSLALTGDGMRWGMDQAQALLGPSFSVSLDASGGGGAPYAVTLAKLEAGSVSASARATYEPAEQPLNASLNASIDAALADIAPVAPGAAGALRAKASVSGVLNAPAFSLQAASDDITTPAGTFRDVRAAVDGNATLDAGGKKSVRASASLALGASPAGPVRFKTLLDAEQGAAGDLAAHVHGVDLALAGTELTADITAALPAPSPAGENAAPSLKGTAAAAIADWRPLAALTGVPISGSKAGFDARFTHDARGQEVFAAWHAESLAMPGAFAVAGVSGTLDATELPAHPNIALTANFGKGEAGPVDWRSGALSVNARRGAGSFAAALRTDNTAPQALRALAAQKGSGDGPAGGERLSASGEFTLSPMRVTLNRLAARLPGSRTGVFLAGPAAVALDNGVSVRGLKLNVTPGKGVVTCDASLAGNEADVTATAAGFPFRLVRELTGAAVPDGTADLSAVLKKNGPAVSGTVDARATITQPPAAGRQQAAPAVVLTLAGALDKKPDPNFPRLRSAGHTARFKGSTRLGIGGPPAEAGEPLAVFNFPLRFSADGVPSPDETAPLGARIMWHGDIAPVWALAPMPDRTLTGTARVDASLGGTLAKPEYDIAAYLANGRFKDDILGILLTNMALEATSSSGSESKLLMRAEDLQNGSIALEGRLTPPDPPEKSGKKGGKAAAPRPAVPRPTVPHLTARGHINHLEPLHRDDLFLRLSGRIAVDGPLDALNIAADAEVERGELSLLTTLGGGVSTLEIADPNAEQAAAPAGPACDITVTVPNRFFIRGRGLDSEWAGELAVRGPLSGPSLTGSLRPVRGTFDLLSRPFAFDKGDISFFGGDRVNPALNLSLTYPGPNITAVVRALGTAKKPELVMESRPPLPQDQIMAEVLFGKEFSQLSRFEALQIANSLRQLANMGDGGLDPLTTMRTSLGLDMLRVGSSGAGAGDSRSVSGAPGAGDIGGGGQSASPDGDGAATPTVEAGKYINDAIYVGVEQGATADSTGVRVEVELLPNLTLQGKSSARSSEVGLGWKKDY